MKYRKNKSDEKKFILTKVLLYDEKYNRVFVNDKYYQNENDLIRTSVAINIDDINMIYSPGKVRLAIHSNSRDFDTSDQISFFKIILTNDSRIYLLEEEYYKFKYLIK